MPVARSASQSVPINWSALRRDLNRLDNAKSAKATDALLNYETVKFFSNEAHEREQFAGAIGDYQGVEYKLLASLCTLNVVQSMIIFVGLAAGLTVCAQASAPNRRLALRLWG